MTDNLEVYNRISAMFQEDICVICGVEVTGTLLSGELLQDIHLEYHRSYWRTINLIKTKLF